MSTAGAANPDSGSSGPTFSGIRIQLENLLRQLSLPQKVRKSTTKRDVRNVSFSQFDIMLTLAARLLSFVQTWRPLARRGFSLLTCLS